METAFYIVGSALVVIALAISFIGMRSERFPSGAVLGVGLAFVGVVVIATAVLAVRASQHEALEREHEENVKASETAEAEDQADQDIGAPSTGGGDEAGGSTGKGDPAAGEQVFVDQSCGSCHALQAAGTTGPAGPDLDDALADKDEAFIHTAIVDPDADIPEGYTAGVMPATFGDSISPADLDNLVAYLYESTHSGSK